MSIDTVAGIIRTHGAERRDKEALRLGDRALTFGELDARSNQVANALAAAGIGPQDRVAFLDKNAIEHFEVQFGGAKLNAVNVAVNWRLAPPEIAYIVNDAKAKVLVVGQEFVPALDAIIGELVDVEKIVVIGGHPVHQSYEEWVDAHDVSDPGVTAGPDDIALQLYSSGTTGRPKGVMLSNGNLFVMLPSASGAIWKLTENSVNLVAMPLFHIGGGGWALAGMYPGARTVLMREVDPAAIVNIIGEQRVTHAFLVPAVLQFMLMLPATKDADFSSLELILYGASPISNQVLLDALKTFGCGFMQAYGATETTGQVTSLPPEDHDLSSEHAERRLRSAGTADPGVELRIVDAASLEDMPVGEVGEILIRTRQNMVGYWNLPDETAKTLVADGWLRTGDAGYVDDDGYLYIHDRVKDMIVSGGENIYPAEIENVLMGHPQVADVAVIGVPSERWGETPKALIVRTPDATITGDELIAYTRDQLAKYKCPTSVDWVEELPRNPSGKILKKDLRAPFWEGHGRMVG